MKLRYKQPAGDRSVLLEHAVPERDTRPTTDFTFGAAVASFGMILRDSPHRGDTSLERVLTMARTGLGEEHGGHRTAFLEVVEKARTLTRPVATERERGRPPTASADSQGLTRIDPGHSGEPADTR